MMTDKAISSSINISNSNSTDTQSTESYQRHKRTPSIPLRVRSTSSGQFNGTIDDGNKKNQDDGGRITATLSPSNAEIPLADPSRASLYLNTGSSSLSTEADIDSYRHAALPQKASEKYGFVVYVGSLLLWYLYLFWAFTPDRYLKAFGIEWYPDRQWALLIPSWIMMTVVYVYVAYFALNLYHTPSLSSMSSITDSQGRLYTQRTSKDQKENQFTSRKASKASSEHAVDHIPPLFDLPPFMVQQTLK